MKILPLKFTKKNQKHVQIKREGDVALYKRNSLEFPKAVTFEVIIITKHNGTTINGNYIEPGELYPSTSQWGEKGWTLCSLQEAESKFKEIVKKVARSQKNREAKSTKTK